MSLSHATQISGSPAADDDDAPTQRDRALETGPGSQAEAAPDGTPAAPKRNRVRNTLRNTSRDADGTVDEDRVPLISPRERAVLELVARLRLIPLGLVHRTLFSDVSRQVVGRLVGRMTRRGWLRTWAEPTVSGGNPRWLVPTAAGRTAGLGTALGTAVGTPAEQLVSTMLPSARTRPLELTPRVVPSFLRHQQEVATLLVRLAQAHGALWYSAWDRPLPQAGTPIALPQPDGVLVVPGAAGPEVVFLEHDRGMESPTHFARAKAERYAELAVRPELCQRLFGFPTFQLAVTVEDFRFHRMPLERLGRLARLLVDAGAARESRLALAGWVYDSPSGAVWCKADNPFVPRPRPAAEAQHLDLRHTVLCPALRPGTGCACRG
jgi:hypothetical protein